MSKKTSKPTQEKINVDSKENMSLKQMINKINESNNIDRIILQFGLQKYQHKSVLEGKPTYKQVEEFFQYLKENQENLQQEYLKFTPQAEQNQQNLNYLQNKTNLQKFIKDEHDFYLKVLTHYEQNVNQDEKGINAKHIPSFIKQVLSGNHTKCFIHKKQYFSSDFEICLKQITDNYAIQCKQISKEDFQYDNFYLMEDQILDYLTFWLKDQSNSHLHVIYARTQKVITKFLQKIQKEQIEMQKNLIETQNINSKIPEQIIQNKIQPIEQKLLKQMNHKSQLKETTNSTKNASQVRPNLANQQKKLLQNNEDYQIQSLLIKSPSKQSLTKQEKFEKLLPDLYSQICRKRAKIHKGITFDQYLADKHIMTLQKFINFCNQSTISKYFSRQSLMDTFKLYAINRITANQKIFVQIMNQLVQKNSQILSLTLLKYKDLMGAKSKNKKSIQKDKLSKYSYKLRPVNGMDLKSIQIELKTRKQEKEQAKLVKKQEQTSLLKKQVGYLVKYQKNKKIGKNYSNYSLSKRNQSIEVFQRNQDKFDPQNIISNYNQNDKLWDEYEAKIWKKQKQNQSQNQSILQSALSKRIQKGENVLRKFTQKSIKMYS